MQNLAPTVSCCKWHSSDDEEQPSVFSTPESLVALVGELADALGCPPEADAWELEHVLLGVAVAVGNLSSVPVGVPPEYALVRHV